MPGTSGRSAPLPAAALLALGRTLLAVLRTRGDLLVVELVQEQRRLMQLALYAGLALISLALCLQLLAFATVAWFWDTPYRWPVAGCLAGLCAAGAALCAVLVLHRLRAGPRPFEATLMALATDLDDSP
jgi:uncharacterized membrane protein YqjE